jgi:hypothetical protein
MIRVRIVRVVNDQNLWILPDEYPQDLVSSRIRVPQMGVFVAEEFQGAAEPASALSGLGSPAIPVPVGHHDDMGAVSTTHILGQSASGPDLGIVRM